MNIVEKLFFNNIYNYPSLYYHRNLEDCKRRWLDHVFLTIGNGIDYHNPKNEDFKGGFFQIDDENKLITQKIVKRIKNGEKIVTVSKLDMRVAKIIKKAFCDMNKNYRRLFLKDFLKEKKKFVRWGSKLRGKYSENTLVLQTYPNREDEYSWHPYPYSLEYTPFYDREKKYLIPKNKIAPEWVEAIVWIYKEAKKWMEDDEKFYTNPYFNWAGKNWNEKGNNLVMAWEKHKNDVAKVCKDYELPYKDYKTPKEMAYDLVEKNRKKMLEVAEKIIQHYS